MKLKLLALSLVINAALVLVFLNRSAPWFDHLAHFVFHPDSNRSAPPPSAPAARAPAEKVINPTTWKDLSASDLKTLAARLKAAGYPPRLQRAIVAAMVAEHFADQHQAITRRIKNQPWWHGSIYLSHEGAKIIADQQALGREEKNLIDDILGPDDTFTPYQLAQAAQQFGNLAPTKLATLSRIASDYDEMISSVRLSAEHILLAEDQAKIAFLEKERRDDIVKVLSPAELFDYDLRSSPTSDQLRNTLSAFKPSEDEFRAIFEISKAVDDQYGSPETMTADQRRQRYSKETQDNLLNAIKGVLPPDRFADYQQKTDHLYLETNALIDRLQLPETATADVVSVQKNITQRANAVLADKTLSTDQRNIQLAALGDEAVARLGPTLTANGLKVYQETGGTWITRLQHPPEPAKKP